MTLKQRLVSRLRELSAPDGWREVRKNPTYARAIAEGIEATFGLSFSGRGGSLMTLGYASVYCEAVHRLCAELNGKRFVPYDCATFGYAINGLAPNGETGIWIVEDGNVDEVAVEIYRDCVRYGQPVWDANKTIEAVAKTVAEPTHDILIWQRPVVYYLAGMPDEATAAARHMVREAGADAAYLGFDVFLQRLEERIANDGRRARE
jgi:hypothetical protein